MSDLFCLCQILKFHPQFRIQRDEILYIFFQLGLEKKLSAENLLRQLKSEFPDLFTFIQQNHVLFNSQLKECLKAHNKGCQFVCYGEESYPSLCYYMEEPPLTLSFMGTPAWSQAESLAVVGSREPCFESMQWMEKEFSDFCASEKPMIVSGGARGIDQKAHALALRHHLPTVVVLPSGIFNIYPESLAEWIDAILQGGGCILSEYSFEQRMHKHLFHHRNRLIAALGKATLLVEARRRSGTLITAEQTLQLGRPVWVVPGHPSDVHFGGSLDLLSEGAGLVRDSRDLKMFFQAESGARTRVKNFLNP